MLSWQQAAGLTAALVVVSIALSVVPVGGLRRAVPFAREAAIIAGLYSLWQLAGTLSLLGVSGAFERAEWIERLEHSVHLPSEATIQNLLTGNAAVAQGMNLYYATMHFTVLFVFLVWLFVRHREQYRPVRRVLALTTLACLLIQLVPVAPPRLLPGYTDLAAQYDQSVYGANAFGADQFSAMPSVHVAWAVLVGIVVWRLASGPGRWLGPLHAVLTVLVVIATANHFWADGIVAVAVLGGSYLLERGAAAGWARLRPVTDARPHLSYAAGGGILP